MADALWIKLMKMGSYLGCHQMPERSFFYKKYQFPVCARCTGVLISAVISLIVFANVKIPVSVCIILSSVMLIDWLLQYWDIKESNNRRRLITGLVGGLGYCTIHLYIYRFVIVHIFDAIKMTI